MPSDQRNSITAKATGLIFLFLDVAAARVREVPFGIPQYVQCILKKLPSRSKKLSVFFCYFDYRGAFQTDLYSYIQFKYS